MRDEARNHGNSSGSDVVIDMTEGNGGGTTRKETILAAVEILPAQNGNNDGRRDW